MVLIPVLAGAALGIGAAEYRARRRQRPRRNPMELGSRKPAEVHDHNRTSVIFRTMHRYPEKYQESTERALLSLARYIRDRDMLRLELPYDKDGQPDLSFLLARRQRSLRDWVRKNQQGNEQRYYPFLRRETFNIISDPMRELPNIVQSLTELERSDPSIDSIIDGWLDPYLRACWQGGTLSPSQMMYMASTFVTREKFIATLARLFDLQSKFLYKPDCKSYYLQLSYKLRNESISPNRQKFLNDLLSFLDNIGDNCTNQLLEILPDISYFPSAHQDGLVSRYFDSFFGAWSEDQLRFARLAILAELPEISLKHARELLFKRENPSKNHRNGAKRSRR
jgi:hypothetical protein